MNAEDVRRLAADSLPALVFSDAERHFPIRAESWLTHTTTAPWDVEAGPDDIGALPGDERHRGTAIVVADDEVTGHARLGGAPNPEDAPIRLESTQDPNAIGNPAYAEAPDTANEVFLSFAGWGDRLKPHEGGDLPYLQAAFSELASAMNPQATWDPIATRRNRPWFGHPQPVSPAVYCEVDWAGAHFRESPPAKDIVTSPLDDFVQVTYYYLFAAREALADQKEVRPLEGQWAAISLFYRAAAGEVLGDDSRPTEIELRGEGGPEWVVLSRDPEGPTCAVERFADMQVDPKSSTHVRAFVGAGTHRFFRDQASKEVPLDKGDPEPILPYEPGWDLEGTFMSGFPAMNGMAAGGGEGLAIVSVLTMGGPIGFVLALLINWISELLWGHDNANTGQIPHAADTKDDKPGVPAGGDVPGGELPPDPGQPAQDGFPTNDGSAQGFDVAFFDMRVISRLPSAAAPDLEPPPWWGYTGRWGIKVPPTSLAWDSGTRRTDHLGGSWARVMAEALVTQRALDVPAPKAP